MAGRPVKNNADYFSHDSGMRNSIKVRALRRKFLHKGYAVWCFILETLTDKDYFELELTDLSIELLSTDFDVTTDELLEIIEYCVSLDLLQKSEDGKILSCKKLVQRFGNLIEKREYDRIRKSEFNKLRNSKILPETEIFHTENNGKNEFSVRNINSKVKKSKVKKSKVKKSKVKESKEKKKKNTSVFSKKDDATLSGSPTTFVLDRIKAVWNEEIQKPKIQALTEDRKAKIRKRLSEWGARTQQEAEDKAREIFKKISDSDFLSGRKNSEWSANFDWVFANDKNWLKIVEGNYDNDPEKLKTHFKAQQATKIPLGIDEYITSDGRRTYGTGMAIIPMSAPPRPSAKHFWDGAKQEWALW